jgi:excisionase family DNA binding protein
MRSPYTIKEAATLLRVSDKTIRRMLGDGLLKEQSRDHRGRILLTPESVETAAAQQGRYEPPRQPVQDVQALAPTVEALGDVSTALAQAWRERDERLIALAEQVGRLELELEQARAENERLRAELEAVQSVPVELVESAQPVVQATDQVSNQPMRRIVLRRILRRLGIG